MSNVWIGPGTDEMGFGHRDLVMVNVHLPERCAPYPCSLHRPSNHHMRDWPTHYRADKWLMERLCPCGVGHPDPDDLAFHVRNGRDSLGVHGCCGCCSGQASPE